MVKCVICTTSFLYCQMSITVQLKFVTVNHKLAALCTVILCFFPAKKREKKQHAQYVNLILTLCALLKVGCCFVVTFLIWFNQLNHHTIKYVDKILKVRMLNKLVSSKLNAQMHLISSYTHANCRSHNQNGGNWSNIEWCGVKLCHFPA